ncbi:MAG TPA: SPFH domain-containing protein [Isosphaeraceae bacterium]|nr:SPFH domain-containing protein [Isosphaeraceae bacterium]
MNRDWKKLLAALAAGLGLAVALFVAAGWCLVAPGEVVVVRRLGRLVEPPWGPGLHWRFPLGIDRLDRVRSDAVRHVTIGQAGPPGGDQEPSTGEALTGDLNLVRIQATVQYRVARPVDFVLHAEPAEHLLARSAEASLTRALARRGVDAVLRSDRQLIARDVERDLQADSDRLALGAAILGVSLTDARPPVEVAADFAAAQAAESHRDRRVHEARTHEAVQLTAAKAQAEAAREAARADATRTTLHARAEAQHFLTLMAEARRSPDLTIRRLYIETLQDLLDRVRRKLILPPGDSLDLTVLGLRGDDAPRRGPPLDPPHTREPGPHP